MSREEKIVKRDKYFALGTTHKSDIATKVHEYCAEKGTMVAPEGSGASGYHFWVLEADVVKAQTIFNQMCAEHPDWLEKFSQIYNPPTPMAQNDLPDYIVTGGEDEHLSIIYIWFPPTFQDQKYEFETAIEDGLVIMDGCAGCVSGQNLESGFKLEFDTIRLEVALERLRTVLLNARCPEDTKVEVKTNGITKEFQLINLPIESTDLN